MARPEITCVLDAGAEVGEGALWDVLEQALFWVDIQRGRLHRFDPATGENRIWEMGEPIGCLALRERGGAVVALQSGFHLFDFATGKKTAVIDPEADRPQNRFNDGATDRQGRFWAGTMRTGEPAPDGAFYRLDADHACTRWQDGFFTTNGLAFSPDGRVMYCSDSNPQVRTIWACDYDLATGTPGPRRVLFDTHDVAGRPDGGTVDADGCYWMAGVGGGQLVRLTPAGRIDRIIALPVERPTKPAFGGADLDVLFVTSISAGATPGQRQAGAGGLLALTGLGVQGVPEVRFRG
jgi:sugar lactone lactonase YvrE